MTDNWQSLESVINDIMVKVDPSPHSRLERLTQEYDWSYTLHVKLTKDEVLGLLKEYGEAKAANLQHSKNNNALPKKDFDIMQNDDTLAMSTTRD